MASGGEILIGFLAREGVRSVFTVPGESFISVLDAMHGNLDVRPITCRCESGAAMMAEAAGKIGPAPGIALVTRGPGAANALSGVYVAHQDGTPMILLVGLPPRQHDGLSAFQAIDIEAVFASVAKWVTRIESGDQIGSVLARAFRAALGGRPGPVVIGLPEDILLESSAAQDAQAPVRPTVRTIGEPDLLTIKRLLAHADRPLVIAGSSDWSEEAAQDLAVFAERFDLPVVASFRRQDHLDNRHHCFVGHSGFAVDAKLIAALKAADVVIALGTRLGEITTQGFRLLRGGQNGQKIVHIAPDADDFRSGIDAALAIVATAPAAAAQLAELPLPGKRPPWGNWRLELRAAYEASLVPQPTPGAVRLEDVVCTLSDRLPEDAIVTNGAGNYAAFLHRYFVYKQYGTQLAPVSGSMGYSLPAAIAAKLRFPERTVVALAGDGCLQMTGQELMTAVQFGLNIIVIVANNGTLGTIRMHQERRYPGRVVGTSLLNPDFAAWARSCGALGERIETTDAFAAALERALGAPRACVIELLLDPEAISVRETITSIRNCVSTRDSV